MPNVDPTSCSGGDGGAPFLGHGPERVHLRSVRPVRAQKTRPLIRAVLMRNNVVGIVGRLARRTPKGFSGISGPR
jgi:hypothetical protein